MIENLTVLLLAGGKSRRSWPIMDKLILPFLGRSFIDHQMEFLQKAGFKKFIVVTTPRIAEGIYDKNVTVVIQEGEGQGAAILSAKNHIRGKPLLILNADDLMSGSLFESLFYILDKTKNILVGYKTEKYFPGGYLVLDGKRVKHILEKPGEGNEPSEYVRLTCDYFINGTTLLYYLEKTYTDKDDLYEAAINEMIKAGEIFEMLDYQDMWVPLKYPWDTLTVMNHYLSEIKSTNIAKTAKVDKTAIIEGNVLISDRVKIMEYAKLTGPLYIGPGTIIGNHTLIRASMIGENCVVGYGSDITRSYIGNNNWFHSNFVGDSVICDNVSLGAGSILANLRFDEAHIYSEIKKIRTNSKCNKLGAIIGHSTRIGVGTMVMPGIKIGSNCLIGPGVIMQEDLEDNQSCYFKQLHFIHKNSIKLISNRDKFRASIE